MLRKVEISNDRKWENIAAAHQSENGYKAISKQLEVREIIQKWKTRQE